MSGVVVKRPAGVNNPVPCPLGTYYPGLGNGANASAASPCEPCAPGYACNSTGLATPKLLCANGTFCYSGASDPVPKAFGGGESDCSEAEWHKCGYGPCPKGYECGEGTGVPSRCQPGIFSPDLGATVCEPCTAGFWCDGVASADVLPCPRGHYRPPFALPGRSCPPQPPPRRGSGRPRARGPRRPPPPP